jgi:hypothetical protein
LWGGQVDDGDAPAGEEDAVAAVLVERSAVRAFAVAAPGGAAMVEGATGRFATT